MIDLTKCEKITITKADINNCDFKEICEHAIACDILNDNLIIYAWKEYDAIYIRMLLAKIKY